MSDTTEHAGFQAPEPAELSPLFPGYEIECLIATGGMGAVYRAIQKSLDRTVALKILPKELSKDAAFCAGFEAEAKAMARLNHPNLIGVYDFGAVNDMLYIIMEYVPGQSIYHSAYGKTLPPKEVVRLVSGICDGLAHAHENGIIHRDIKPSNILLDLNSLPKIGDFGLARPIERKIEEGEEIFGTPHYTAPEVVNSPHSVDHRADIFSVGVLLHELLTGKLPADDVRPASLIARCDPRFDAIIRRATHPITSSRYSNAHELEKDLRAITGSSPNSARSTPGAPARRVPRRTANKTRQKKSNSGPLIAFLLVGAIAAAAVVALRKPPAAPSSSQAPLPPPTIKETKLSTRSDSLDDEAARLLIPKAPKPKLIEPSDSETEMKTQQESEKLSSQEVTPPGFDTTEFFPRVRKIMQDKGKPIVATYKSNLLINLAEFERTVTTELRKLKYRSEKGFADDFAAWRADGGRLPLDVNDSLDSIEDIEDLSTKYLQQQAAYDQKILQDLKSLTDTYILGINKQIERLQSENNSAGVSALNREIEKIEEDPTYFPSTVLGVELPTD
jgi:serine/threonine protein kinase